VSHHRRRPALGPAGRAHAAPGRAQHGHRVPPRRPGPAGRHSRAVRERVTDTRMASTLTAPPTRDRAEVVKVATVEHLMSALAGLGIDNLYVDVTAPEIPILDGSAGSFVFLIQSVGVVEQAAPKRFIRVSKTGRGPRRRQVGAPRAAFRFFGSTSRSISGIRPSTHRSALRRRLRRDLLRPRDRARAHLRLHAGCRGAALASAWPRAAASRTRS
jgi:hypothetical protein